MKMYNFETIFKDCVRRFTGFDKEIVKKRAPRSFEDSILSKKKEGLNPVIAEVKPASPQGMIRKIDDVKRVVREMLQGGACGISVLTEEKYFMGSLDNLKKAAEVAKIPVLRKDFIFHPDQIKEAYYYGADSVLLIAGLLTDASLAKLAEESRRLGMEPLIEVHSEEDVEKAVQVRGRVILINNRDKDTLKVDLKRTRRLTKRIKSQGVKISASGISTPEELRYVLEYCDAALVGSAIMQSENISRKLEELIYG
jgi:indole-3-glycerol phosphate synthase